jgi:hypothetical protein
MPRGGANRVLFVSAGQGCCMAKMSSRTIGGRFGHSGRLAFVLRTAESWLLVWQGPEDIDEARKVMLPGAVR